MSRRCWKALGFGLAVAFVALVHGRIPAEPRHMSTDGAWVPQPEVASLLAVGFESVVADWQWIRAVQISGGTHEDPVIHAPVLGRLIEVVTHLNPWVDHPYRFAAIWMTDSEERVRQANDLLVRGMAHHPDDWRMRFYKGFNHFFYLEENAKAADELEKASSMPGAPRYLGRLVARLRSQSGGLEAAAIFLTQMLEEATDEYARSDYQAALDEIEIEHAARFLDRARAAHVELTGQDIERVEDLLLGEHPVLRSLPPAEPSSLPAEYRKGSRWVLDDEGRIVSTYYDRRYEPSFHALEKERRERWRQMREVGSTRPADTEETTDEG
ncbi:MAG: hypothetical protein ACQGVK_05010 [Myxococcota bacterium]